MTKLNESNGRGARWKEEKSWKLWSESSIWSVVCAMELGILTESIVQNVPLSSLCRKPAKRRGRKRKSRTSKYTRKFPPRMLPPTPRDLYDRSTKEKEEPSARDMLAERDKENRAYRYSLRKSRGAESTAKTEIGANREGKKQWSHNDERTSRLSIDASTNSLACNDNEAGSTEEESLENNDVLEKRSDAHDSPPTDNEISLDVKSLQEVTAMFLELGANGIEFEPEPEPEPEPGRLHDSEDVTVDENVVLRQEIGDLSIGGDYADLSICPEAEIAENRAGDDANDLDDVPLAERMPGVRPTVISVGEGNGNYSKHYKRRNRKRQKASWSIYGTEESKEYRQDRRVTRGLTKITEETVKENFIGKLVWGSCSGWWPAIVINAEDAGMTSTAGKVWVFWVGESRISLLNEKTQVEPFSSKLKVRLDKKSDARGKCIDTAIQMLRRQLGCVLTKPYHVWLEKNLPELDRRDKLKFYPYPANVQRRLDQLKEFNKRANEKYDSDMKRSSELAKKQLSEKSKQVAINPERLPLKEQKPGVIAWAKIVGVNWWPAMIVDYRDCCMREPGFGCQWIMWYGDYKLSQIHHNDFIKFYEGLEKMREYIQNTKRFSYLVGVLQASKDFCARLGYRTDKWTLADAFSWSEKSIGSELANDCQVANNKCGKYSETIVRNLNDLKVNQSVDDDRQHAIRHSEALKDVISGKCKLGSLCLMCMEIPPGETEEHPFFEASLCKECSEDLKPRVFVFGEDGKSYYCTLCAGFGVVVMCDRDDCPRVYCTACLKYLLCPETYNEVLLADPWECFLCKNDPGFFPGGLVPPRADWKSRLARMFRTSPVSNVDQPPISSPSKKTKIRVLSLFDGLSTGLVVLLKLGIVPEVYYASEIDRDALTVSSWHFGDKVIQLGDVRDITNQKLKEIAPIDLIIGGSPCNDLSLVNPARLGLHDPNGTGILFFEYCRILKTMKKLNKDRHLFWMYENVASMPSKYRLEINENLGREPDLIDSADFSPQHRLRLYWHNLPVDPRSITRQSQQDVQDVLTPNCDRYALVKKIRTVTTRVNSLKQGKSELKPILMRNESDNLWITELEEIFGFPRHYTDVKNMSATKRQRLIGKSWSVQTLTAVLQPLCIFFETNHLV